MKKFCLLVVGGKNLAEILLKTELSEFIFLHISDERVWPVKMELGPPSPDYPEVVIHTGSGENLQNTLQYCKKWNLPLIQCQRHLQDCVGERLFVPTTIGCVVINAITLCLTIKEENLSEESPRIQRLLLLIKKLVEEDPVLPNGVHSVKKVLSL